MEKGGNKSAWRFLKNSNMTANKNIDQERAAGWLAAPQHSQPFFVGATAGDYGHIVGGILESPFQADPVRDTNEKTLYRVDAKSL
jgi:hypothetical protein